MACLWLFSSLCLFSPYFKSASKQWMSRKERFRIILDRDKSHTLARPGKKKDFLVISLSCGQDVMEYHIYVAIRWLVWTFIAEKNGDKAVHWEGKDREPDVAKFCGENPGRKWSELPKKKVAIFSICQVLLVLWNLYNSSTSEKFFQHRMVCPHYYYSI